MSIVPLLPPMARRSGISAMKADLTSFGGMILPAVKASRSAPSRPTLPASNCRPMASVLQFGAISPAIAPISAAMPMVTGQSPAPAPGASMTNCSCAIGIHGKRPAITAVSLPLILPPTAACQAASQWMAASPAIHPQNRWAGVRRLRGAQTASRSISRCALRIGTKRARPTLISTRRLRPAALQPT